MQDLSDLNTWELEADSGNVTDFSHYLEPTQEQDPIDAIHSILSYAISKYSKAQRLKNVEYGKNYVSIAKISDDLYAVSYGKNTFQLKRLKS